MKRTRLIFASALTFVGLFAAGSAFCMSEGNLPAEKTLGSVTYMTGGIGQDEAAAMKHAESTYPLSLEFVAHATPNDAYLANVDVTIKDHAGKSVLSTKSDGPFLFVKLPPGNYSVTAENDDETKTRRVTLAAHKPRHLIFVWQ